ncbi:hypothetical protein [Spirosoma sp. 209]|uniref:hypothetical protein n=1 Tax=Spirosoma sp. 209 TaxID=1955701 RepID=UPI00098D2681|nr:hypothetical protein [Spirosoma sp. 209]
MYYSLTRNVLLLVLLICLEGVAQPSAFVRVSKTNPRYLELAGKPFIPVGPNICFARLVTNGDSLLAYYDHYFGRLAASGGNFTRVWLSTPMLEVEKQQPGLVDKQTETLIDGLVGLAQKHGIRIKFCLEHFRKVTGSPAPFPSSVPFDKPVYAGAVSSMDAFFRSEKGKQLYLNRVAFFAGKYRNNPTVFGWELWNELNSVRVDDESLLLTWTTDMLDRVKALVPNQLVMQTLGSYDSPKQHELYRTYSALPNNELAQAHRYLDKGASLPVCQAPMDVLASDAVSSLLALAPAKPVLLSEVGAVEPHHTGPFLRYPADTQGTLLHDLLFAPFFAGAAGPGQSWHWDYYIEKNNLWWHFSRFNEAISGFDPVAQQAAPFRLSADNGLTIYGLRGRTTTLLWVKDTASNWKSELEANRPAAVLSRKTIKPGLPASRTLSFYDPWKGVWTKGTPGKALSLPDFSRSIIVKLDY